MEKTEKLNIQCFAPIASPLGHTDASLLKKKNIYLGDYADDEASVTGSPYGAVVRAYYESTNAGTRHDRKKLLQTNAPPKQALEKNKPMLCAGCVVNGKDNGAEVTIEERQFAHSEMSRSVRNLHSLPIC